jgi:7-cyano-7-deazaguanine synthase in queuosine biosynthesis
MKLLKNYQLRNEHILQRIRSNPINDMGLITNIETQLMKKRGYVFKMPSPQKPIIVLMSGGLDTTVVLSLLLSEYNVSVYPLFINRHLPHERKIRESIEYFDNYFMDHYPRVYHHSFEMSLTLPPAEVKQILLLKENDVVKYKNRKGVPLQPSFYAHYAMYYAKYLEETEGIKVRTIIGGWLPSNSEWYAYESFLSLRSIMLDMCCVDNDFSWQFSSLPMEKELGFYFDKDVLVKLGNTLHVPLEKTWTCFQGKHIQCGECPPCFTRRSAFQKANIIDKTTYEDGLTRVQRIRKKTKRFITRMIHIN